MTFASLGEVFAELDAEAQAQAHRVFVQLVRPGEGSEDTRRLATSAEAGEENWGLVQLQPWVCGMADADQEPDTILRG